jgi:hypothetical protein
MDVTGLNLFVPGCLHYRFDPPAGLFILLSIRPE